MKDKLTAKQEAFCVNYFVMRNATQAAIKAGYSPHLIETHSTSLLNNASIKARLIDLQATIMPSSEILEGAYNKRINALNEVIEHKIELPVSAGHRIAAVHEVNLMEHIFEAQPPINQDNRVLNIYVTSDRAKELVEKIGDRLDASQ